MTERQKMLAGELYDPLDPELVAARERARDLCQALNATREAQQEERRRHPPRSVRHGRRHRLDAAAVLLRLRRQHRARRARLLQLQLRRPRRLPRAHRRLHAVWSRRADLHGHASARTPNCGGSEEFGKPVEIGSDVWVGGGAIILPGVRIGSRAVIGAGSVVTRDIPDEVFAAGNPCRVIREITE